MEEIGTAGERREARSRLVHFKSNVPVCDLKVACKLYSEIVGEGVVIEQWAAHDRRRKRSAHQTCSAPTAKDT